MASQNSLTVGIRKVRTYSPDVKEKAREMVKRGETKTAVADSMGIPHRTMVGWTSDIVRRRIHPPKIKWKVREMVKNGMTKAEAARRAGVRYQAAVNWTTDMPTAKGNPGIRGKTLGFLQDLINNGYVFSKRSEGFPHEYACYRTLRKYVPVKRVKVGSKMKIHIMYFLEGKEEEAFRAFVGRMKRRVVSHQELGYIRKAFGIENRRYHM